MLIYLAAPIESGMEAGNRFREVVKYELGRFDERITIYDPYAAIVQYDNLDWGAVRGLHRSVLRRSDAMIALLAGCETWREIEYFIHNRMKPVFGIWPVGSRVSPTAVLDLTVVNSVADALQGAIDCLKQR